MVLRLHRARVLAVLPSAILHFPRCIHIYTPCQSSHHSLPLKQQVLPFLLMNTSPFSLSIKICLYCSQSTHLLSPLNCYIFPLSFDKLPFHSQSTRLPHTSACPKPKDRHLSRPGHHGTPLPATYLSPSSRAPPSSSVLRDMITDDIGGRSTHYQNYVKRCTGPIKVTMWRDISEVVFHAYDTARSAVHIHHNP